MGVETHKVEIVPVKLEPHPNADKLSIVRVYNFTVCVNTADWQGVTQAAYVQPDSVMPDKPEYRFLKDTTSTRKEREAIEAAFQAEFTDIDAPSDLAYADRTQKLAALEEKIDKNTKYLRITVKKLRGVVSMGMLLPVPRCELCADGVAPISVDGRHHWIGGDKEVLCLNGVQIGDDVADLMGITHYEPPILDQAGKGDDIAPPPPMTYAPKYDIESIYKYATCFEPGEMVYVSEKIDGANARYVVTLEDSGVCHCGEAVDQHNMGSGHSPVDNPYRTFHVGSRTEWKKEEGNSIWWRAAKQNPWIEEWCHAHPGRVLYGEVFGWVQSLRYGAAQGHLYFKAFDVLEGMEYWDAERFLAEVPEEHRVPTLGVMPFDFDRLQVHADGQSYIKGANHMREGIVVKPLKERKHWELGRVMLKMVSNAYLEKSAR